MSAKLVDSICAEDSGVNVAGATNGSRAADAAGGLTQQAPDHVVAVLGALRHVHDALRAGSDRFAIALVEEVPEARLTKRGTRRTGFLDRHDSESAPGGLTRHLGATVRSA